MGFNFYFYISYKTLYFPVRAADAIFNYLKGCQIDDGTDLNSAASRDRIQSNTRD